ncbi:MAG: hypothetical protein ACREO2_07155, partial [Arenimonas sp.]
MKRAALVLLAFTGLVWFSNAVSQTSTADTQRRIAALEAEQTAIRRESFQIAGGQTVAESIRKTSANKFAIENQIRTLEPVIERIEGTRAELVRMREDAQSRTVLTAKDIGQNLTQDAAEDVALAGASQAAKRIAFWAGLVFDVAEVGNRYEIKYSSLKDLKQIIDTHNANVNELKDVAIVLYHAQSVERNKLARLQEMDARDREVWRE